ncbi:D-serine deaminase-like pyridoxal phosphate-dependent protein [Rhodothalassium salexigens DSM 2132]|uniref:D-serine deaminase-like pyridoxal phosphate-dependent protein n=1 Tax=Rhodothalassium salexigens DSM 2132 TaxID=1188247 RepID=A0A4R2PQX3_RHOSA|nr:alanine racemase [Rhodothalassium salexigens]MBB4210067.1 D-serine deaminase-like pyridoxal phosphate-dependent protein [Rhodothalassium salexigens DSM 2132]TCP38232.1 D-serine deaminase-like pyridoxal phosphate-dependent protein [Rhodothalassium salexigens DSM 2132]
MPIRTLDQIPTPALLLDTARLDANLGAMAARARALGVTWRPHFKTLKAPAVVPRLRALGATGAAVSTPAEAAACVAAGLGDLWYTAPFAPHKAALLAPLVANGLSLTLLLDDPAHAAQLDAAAQAAGVRLGAMIELDIDGHRGGVEPDSPRFGDLLGVLGQARALDLVGLYGYGGGTYDLAERPARQALVARIAGGVAATADHLTRHGWTVRHRALGGSPVLAEARAADLAGIDSLCAGVAMVEDLAQCGNGVAQPARIALSVLARVVQHQRETGRLFVDAGALALSKDRSTGPQADDQGYGLLCDAHGTPLGDGDVVVTAVSQEHGLVARRGGGALPATLLAGALAAGQPVRILPNHACITAAGHDGYWLVDEAGGVAGTWARVNGWIAPPPTAQPPGQSEG